MRSRSARIASPTCCSSGCRPPTLWGTSYGPGSQEYLDALIRLDGWLDDFMREAERRAEKTGGVLFALSADHGVLPLPETIPGARRIDARDLRRRLRDALVASIGKEDARDLVAAEKSGNVYFDPDALEKLGMTADQAADAARRAFSGFWEIARVFKASELAPSSAGDTFLDLQRHSFDPERSGDLVLQPCEKCLVASSGAGTSHGSPYEYDRRVPLILMGPGIPAGEDDGQCRTVDLVPTIAHLLGITFDQPRDGRPLELAPARPSQGTR